MGKIIEATALVIIVAYVAANGDSFAQVITAIGDTYSKAVSALMGGTGMRRTMG